MKKIIFFIPNLDGGGAEKVLVNLVNYLDKSKYNITVLTLFNKGINKKYLKDDIKYKYIFNRNFRGNSIILKLFSPQFLYKKFIQDEYDILIAYLEQVPTRIFAGCKDTNVKKIAWVHTEVKDLKVFLKPFRSKDELIWCYKQYNKIICVSNDVKNSLVKYTGINKDIEVKYNVIDNKEIINKGKEEIEEINYDENKINLIIVGRLTRVKGHERLLNVYKRIIDENILNHHLYILGEGEERNKLENYIEQNNLHNYITLLGYKENPYNYIKKSDLLICSSYREGFSTVVVESLILETAVITTRCSGMDEILECGKYGAIVDNNEEALYQGLKKILVSDGELKRLKKMAIERGKIFDIKSSVIDIEHILDSL